ncbi:NAD(P)/FAD-dependent oxidoreductase [Promethearchaeum syntrophicum]|uniref:NAD(P)/FAD-dependent oxidoreductase n=1 Tax=Promethearchaeum syntrophicum TaxID=2594042 RepID=A0A5B9DF98_9ARCH|nr:geranylgeranyl reductase family protein [Candidatus Prometheoarchaeum syntrophicum]QEE18009.1 Digeranylgeranylglycerophospholipid reductase [Candidatus Prometheoarchaeum syntrophicum]
MSEKNQIVYDVCIVGAGPGGSTSAYHLAKQGKKILLLEKDKFPRRKICGDAMFKTIQTHLEKMGLLQEILDEGHGRWADKGGLVSPRGITYFGASAKSSKGSLALSVKRTILDEKLVRLAQKTGATLVEEYNVGKVKFSTLQNHWIINSKGQKNEPFKAKMLIAADGSTSALAQSIGIVKNLGENKKNTVCSTVYIEAGTHRFQQDGVVYYPSELVPGYVSLFREADDSVSYCCYILPGGSCTKKDLSRMHHEILDNYQPIKDALGPDANIESMKAAPIRYGMEKRTYADHFIVLGDAAGHADPLTGGGIAYAMDAGTIAAEVIAEGFRQNDLSEEFLTRYQQMCMEKFGNDHKWSLKMAKFLARHPIFIDAFAAASIKRGDKFMAMWAQIMCGERPKRHFFRPILAIPLLKEVIKLKLKKKPH